MCLNDMYYCPNVKESNVWCGNYFGLRHNYTVRDIFFISYHEKDMNDDF